MKDADKQFIQGVCFAAAIVERIWSQSMMAAEILGSAAITNDRMRMAEVDEYDMQPCRNVLRRKSGNKTRRS